MDGNIPLFIDGSPRLNQAVKLAASTGMLPVSRELGRQIVRVLQVLGEESPDGRDILEAIAAGDIDSGDVLQVLALMAPNLHPHEVATEARLQQKGLEAGDCYFD